MVNAINVMVLAIAAVAPSLVAAQRQDCVTGTRYCGYELTGNLNYPLSDLDDALIRGGQAVTDYNRYNSLYTCNADHLLDFIKTCQQSDKGICNPTTSRPNGQAICGEDEV